ncbi:MAG: NAD-dependent epimerase/dehydratase family protein [Desulfobacteraceae bacterium]|nr:NAD-dependent epimerase/dehydratase family protein [Desulfobacteraceae bacterium]
MKRVVLVTGANGHLGNNLVRKLIANGETVRAGVRNPNNTTPFKGLNCDIVHADLLDKKSLMTALDGVHTLYQVAAVYKHWAKDPEKEIIQPNLLGTKNILQIAAQQKIKKIVYVSSIATLDRQQDHMNELSWGHASENPYYHSKTESEKLALKLAERLNLFLVSVLPGAMIGPHCHGRLTPTMTILKNILMNTQPIDPELHIHFVSIEDVVNGMIVAAHKGKKGERYILSNESCVSTSDIFQAAKTISPKIKTPLKPPKSVLQLMAFTMELIGKITGKEPNLTRHTVNTYYKDKHTLDLSKSMEELGFNPQNPVKAIQSTLAYLKVRQA